MSPRQLPDSTLVLIPTALVADVDAIAERRGVRRGAVVADMVAEGVEAAFVLEQITPPLPDMETTQNPSWWVVSEPTLLDLLRRAQAGEPADVLLLELTANSDHEQVDP